MRQLVFRECLVSAGFTCTGLLCGAVFGLAGWGAFSGLLVYLLLQGVQASRFLSWVMNGQIGSLPALNGLWLFAGTRLYHARSAQREATHNIRKVFQRIAQLTHAIDEGIVILDSGFHLQWWNNSAARLLGLKAEDRKLVLTGLVRNPGFVSYLESVESSRVIELPDMRDNGAWKSYAAYRFGEGEIVLIITDITRLKKAELMRKDFVGNISHELRTPLTVLRGYLETLVDSGMVDNPRALKAFEQMRNQVLRMQSMADDLITLTKLDTQPPGSEGQLEKVNLLPLFNRLVEEASFISEGQHELVIDCPQDLYLQFNAMELYSALSNLVINAVRHNPAGTRVTVSAAVNDASLDIHIVDNGKGISKEALPRLTERFYREDSSRHSGKGGTGLGLAIVKHIISRYGGQLLITSKPGEGSDFLCRFPLKKKI